MATNILILPLLTLLAAGTANAGPNLALKAEVDCHNALAGSPASKYRMVYWAGHWIRQPGIYLLFDDSLQFAPAPFEFRGLYSRWTFVRELVPSKLATARDWENAAKTTETELQQTKKSKDRPPLRRIYIEYMNLVEYLKNSAVEFEQEGATLTEKLLTGTELEIDVPGKQLAPKPRIQLHITKAGELSASPSTGASPTEAEAELVNDQESKAALQTELLALIRAAKEPEALSRCEQSDDPVIRQAAREARVALTSRRKPAQPHPLKALKSKSTPY